MSVTNTLALAFMASMLFASTAFAQGSGVNEGGVNPELGDDSVAQEPETGYGQQPPSSSQEAMPGPGAGLGPISVGLLLGYGTDFEDADLNIMGFGFGLRGGYTLDIGVYVGAKFVYFLGGSVEEDIPMVGTMEMSYNVMMLSLEGGYDIDVEPIIIRPSLDLGLAITGYEATSPAMAGLPAQTEDDTSTDFLLGLGASVLYPIEAWFVGGDLRLYMVLGEDDFGYEGFSLLANGGYTF